MSPRNLGFLLGALALSAAPNASAAVRTVGTTAGCEFDRPEAAFAAARNGDVVRIAGTYLGVSGSIVDRDLTIAGGYANCTNDDPGGTTILDGQGGPGRRILTILGNSHVRIVDVNFMHGNDRDDVSSGIGGCIAYTGPGSLTLRNVRLQECRATTVAGAIYMADAQQPAVAGKAAGNRSRLVFEDQVEVLNAESGYGGGLLVEGNVDVDIRGTGRFAGNRAPTGAALIAQGGATVTIGVSGPSAGGGPAYFSGNLSEDDQGSTVFVADGATLRMFGTDPARALRFTGSTGQLVIDVASFNPESGATVCAWNVAATANPTLSFARANGPGASFYVNPGNAAACGPRPATAGECTGTECGLIADNGVPASNNSALFQVTDGTVSLERVTLARNRMQRNLVRTLSQDATFALTLRNVGIWRNAVGGDLLDFVGQGAATIANTTIVANTIGRDAVLAASNGGAGAAQPLTLMVSSSILDQPNKLALKDAKPAGALTATASYLAATDISTLPVGSIGVIKLSSPGDNSNPVISAGYRNANGDAFDIVNTSRLVDYAPSPDAGVRDLAGRQRTRDLGSVVDFFGPGDVGAFETQREVGEIFADGFE